MVLKGLWLPVVQPVPPVLLRVMVREPPLVLQLELLLMEMKCIPVVLAVQLKGVWPKATKVPLAVPERTVK